MVACGGVWDGEEKDCILMLVVQERSTHAGGKT